MKAHQDDDTAWYNTGTAALAAGDPALARATLARASASLDPELRFRALYNLGLLALLEARSDSGANRETHLADAERAYREALLLKPHHLRAKWNLELVDRLRGGGGANKPNPPPPPTPGPSGGGGGGGNGQQQQQPQPQNEGGNAGGMSESQADQVLRSIGQEELRTRKDRTGRTRRAAAAGVKDW